MRGEAGDVARLAPDDRGREQPAARDGEQGVVAQERADLPLERIGSPSQPDDLGELGTGEVGFDPEVPSQQPADLRELAPGDQVGNGRAVPRDEDAQVRWSRLRARVWATTAVARASARSCRSRVRPRSRRDSCGGTSTTSSPAATRCRARTAPYEAEPSTPIRTSGSASPVTQAANAACPAGSLPNARSSRARPSRSTRHAASVSLWVSTPIAAAAIDRPPVRRDDGRGPGGLQCVEVPATLR